MIDTTIFKVIWTQKHTGRVSATVTTHDAETWEVTSAYLPTKQHGSGEFVTSVQECFATSRTATRHWMGDFNTRLLANGDELLACHNDEGFDLPMAEFEEIRPTEHSHGRAQSEEGGVIEQPTFPRHRK